MCHCVLSGDFIIYDRGDSGSELNVKPFQIDTNLDLRQVKYKINNAISFYAALAFVRLNISE